MGSSVSFIVSNYYMEEFENKVLRIAETPPGLWERYVVDSFVIQDIEHKDKFLHVNSIGKAMKFTVEDTMPDGAVYFQDTIITPIPEGALFKGVYRKLTHTDQYLQWDSHYYIAAKLGIIIRLA